MSFELANSWWMYLMAFAVTVFVLIGSIIFIIKSYKDAKAIGMDKSYLKRTIITSALFTVIPSISILIGIIALSGVIGIPLPWIRLSVIGALHYETAAVDAAYNDITMNVMTTQQFVTIAFVMTLGILSGPLYCLFGFKAYDKKVLAKARGEAVVSKKKKIENDDALTTAETEKTLTVPPETPQNATPVSENEGKKKSFGPILFNAAFIAMICSFLAEDVAKLKLLGTGATALDSFTPSIVIVVSFLMMAVFDLLSKKLNWKWLDNFSLGLSMLVGMGAAAIIG